MVVIKRSRLGVSAAEDWTEILRNVRDWYCFRKVPEDPSDMTGFSVIYSAGQNNFSTFRCTKGTTKLIYFLSHSYRHVYVVSISTLSFLNLLVYN